MGCNALGGGRGGYALKGLNIGTYIVDTLHIRRNSKDRNDVVETKLLSDVSKGRVVLRDGEEGGKGGGKEGGKGGEGGEGEEREGEGKGKGKERRSFK